MTYPFKKAFEDAKAHARKVFPHESCGLIVRGKYIACENAAAPADKHKADDVNCECVLCSFQISADVYMRHSAENKIDMIVHSHPNGPLFPSHADMESQISTDLPWAILALDDERVGDPIIWGDGADIPPLLGRSFMHGVTDCYSLIRDAYRLGKDELAKQDIPGWPFGPITLMEQPRSDAWWANGQNHYENNFLKAGFVRIDESEIQPGDVFLMKIRSEVSNHAGILVSNDLIMHHLPSRLSRREPAGLWARQATHWLRYIGVENA